MSYIVTDLLKMNTREASGLVVARRTPEREVGGSILTQVAVLCSCARYIYLPKVLVIPRKRWLRPDLTEKLFTGMFKNETKRNMNTVLHISASGRQRHAFSLIDSF